MHRAAGATDDVAVGWAKARRSTGPRGQNRARHAHAVTIRERCCPPYDRRLEPKKSMAGTKPGHHHSRTADTTHGTNACSLFGGVFVALVFAGEDTLGNEAGILANRRFDARGDVRILLEEEL